MNSRTIVIAVLIVLIVILGGYSMLGNDETDSTGDTATTESG